MPREPDDTAEKNQPTTSKSAWTRTDTNFWLDVLLGLAFAVYVGISVIIRFIFPAASLSAGWKLWGYPLESWMQAQFVGLAILAGLILLHVMLHWNWVCNVYMQRVRGRKNQKPDDGIQTIVGVGIMIALLNAVGAVVAVAALTIHAP